MPELPEAQTVVSDLNKKIVGRRILNLWSDWPKVLKDLLDQRPKKLTHDHVAAALRFLKNERILRVRRRAKNILFELTHHKMMLAHQKMTGHFLVGKWKVVKGDKRHGTRDKVIPIEPKAVVSDPYNGYIHLIFYLSGGVELGLSDVRKFAKVVVGRRETIESLPELSELGPEPLSEDFAFKILDLILKRERRKIKPVLMDPFRIAGIGNIYSDDILWTAKIHPARPANALTQRETVTLFHAIKDVLQKAVKLRGTSTSDFRDTAGKEGKYTDYRKVYQRTGEPCARCKTPIKRIVIGARSAHFCPHCQRT